MSEAAGMPSLLSRAPRRAWLVLSAACLVPAVLDALQLYIQGQIVGRGPASWRDVFWQGSEWIILGALVPLTYYLGRRFPVRRPHLARNLAANFAGALVLCVAWASSGAALRWVLRTHPDDISVPQYLASWVLTSLPWSVFMYFTVLGCVHAFAYFVEAREREAQAARLAAQLAEARLGALRMQLNPHFLFNSLNAITVLVRDHDTRGAARMLELLSDVLRQVLRTDRSHEISLAGELHFLEQYLAIEQVRFSDRLRVTFAVDERVLDAAVPALILQPLVENALRHGIAKLDSAGTLEIGAEREGDDLVLRVRDDGPGVETFPAAPDRGEGVGLANTRERLATLYGQRARLDLSSPPGVARGTVATVRLPYHDANA